MDHMSAESLLDRAIRRGTGWASDVVDETLDWVNERSLRLAVTGLSRSGKTIFTTALVHNLIRFADRRQALPAIADLDNILSVIERPQPNPELATFPYEANLAALTANPPYWPPSTDQLSEIRLEVHYRPRSWVRRQINRRALLNIDIVDYPGEWLLDLPLLDTSYEDWSAGMLKLARRLPRRRLAEPWLGALASVRPEARAEEADMRRLSEAYRHYLKACAEPALGLTLLQPGRFLSPGGWDLNAPALNFCPMERPAGATRERGSLHGALAERYDVYRRKIVRDFYEKHFTGFDRQIVLVDLLRSLKAGPAAFEEAREAMALILRSFEHGQSSLLARLGLPWGQHKIDRVIMAASKADHVSRSQQGNLESLLRDLLGRAGREIKARAVDTKILAIAALRCTSDRIDERDGNRLSVIVGVPVGGTQPRVLWTGEVPDRMPGEGDWQEGDYRFIDFLPKPMAPGAPDGFEHLRLDEAVKYLIADRFS
jgi:predicted YcjX-like family ATPase